MENTQEYNTCTNCGEPTVQSEYWQEGYKHNPNDNDHPYANQFCIRQTKKMAVRDMK